MGSEAAADLPASAQAIRPSVNRRLVLNSKANPPTAAATAAETAQELSLTTFDDPALPLYLAPVPSAGSGTHSASRLDGSRSQGTIQSVPCPRLWVKLVTGNIAVVMFEKGALDGVENIGGLNQAINRALQQTSSFSLKSKSHLYSRGDSSEEPVVIVRIVDGLIRKTSIDTVWKYAVSDRESLGRDFKNPVLIANASSSSSVFEERSQNACKFWSLVAFIESCCCSIRRRKGEMQPGKVL